MIPDDMLALIATRNPFNPLTISFQVFVSCEGVHKTLAYPDQKTIENLAPPPGTRL